MINYYLLMKPGILLGNLVTFAAGFLLASKGGFDIQIFLTSFFGLALIMASGCVFNNYIDAPLDRKMERTKNRALAAGLITPFRALLFGCVLLFSGNAILGLYTNLLTLCVADFGFFVYVVLYSLWKSRTIYGTAIGSVAGAVPPIVGYCAVSNQFDAGALIFFSMMVLWQMPHFFAIALYHFDDYSAAGIPVLPLKKGVLRTKIHMALYIVAFIGASLLLTSFNYTGKLYAMVALTVGLLWLALSLRGFSITNNKLWGRQMFAVSLFAIMSICCAIVRDCWY